MRSTVRPSPQVQGRHLRLRQQLPQGRGERHRYQGVDRAALDERCAAPVAASARRSAPEGDLAPGTGEPLTIDLALHRLRGLHRLLPAGSMGEEARGFRIYAGGKLGRVPFLGSGWSA